MNTTRVLHRLNWGLISAPRTRSHSVNAGINLLEWAGRIVPQGPIVTSVKTTWKWTWLALMNELAPQSETGEFVRAPYAFHQNIGSQTFPVETDRYHVYVGNACPWCHRVVLAIIVLGLEKLISVGELQDDPEKASRGGWVFEKKDPITGCRDLRGVYDECCGDTNGFRGRCTAPLLIDKKERRIVSNESGLIIKNLNDLLFAQGTNNDLRPEEHLAEMEQLNNEIYETVNNGVYKCGFATSQQAYNEASDALFRQLDHLDRRLSTSRFLLGEKFTESDLRLYPTLIRFDSIYATVFRCSKKRFSSYPHLNRWLKDVYSIYLPSGSLQIRTSMDLADARRSYCELFPLNPSGIVVDGPDESSIGLDDKSGTSLLQNDNIFYKKNV